MSFVIPHIRKDSKYHSDSDHMKKVNNVIKKLFRELSVDKMAVAQDLFWTNYTLFDNKNFTFDGDEFIWIIKDIRDGNSHFWHLKYPIPCTKVIGFVACRFTSKVFGIGASERSWGDFNTIKSSKISAIRRYVSEKHSIVYTSSYIESARIEKYHSDKNNHHHFLSHTWNEDYDDFDQQ